MALGVGSRIGLVGALPLVGLIVFAAIHMRDVWETRQAAGQYRTAIVYAVAANGLIHELQRERGSAALFIGSKGTQFGDELRSQRQRTDAAITAHLKAIDLLAADPDLADLAREARTAETAAAAAQALRPEIDALKATGAQSFTALTKPIDLLFEAIHHIEYVASDARLLLPLDALLNFMRAKEAGGQERATLAAGFAAKAFTPALYVRFAGLVRMQEVNIDAFLEEATPEQRTMYDTLSRQPPFSAVGSYRKQAEAFLETRSTGDAEAPQWFAISTQRIDLMKQMEDRLTGDLSALANAEVDRNQENLNLAGAVTIALVLLVSALAVLIARGIILPVNAVTGALQKLAGGDVDAIVPVRARRDQIGAIIAAYESFRSNAKDKIRLEREAAEQREIAERERAERQAKGDRAVAEIAGLVDQISGGRLDQRINEADKDGDFLRISSQINRMTAMLHEIIGQIARVCGAMAEGDLRQSIRGDYHGVFSELQGSTNGMAERLRDFAGRLSTSASAVKLASGEISEASQDLAQRTESQAAAIEETAASMHEVTATVKQNADNAQAANQLAAVARDTAETGGKVVADAVAAVTRIEDSARKIADIVGLIDEIAFQTNLLALNASVEAARAGEAGKGFAVVAQEVRALAQRSANASKDIKALITESNAQVKTGASLVNQTGGSLTDIVNAVKKVSDIVAEIAAASREQTTGLEQVNTAVGSMDEITQRNAALVEETSASAQALATQARELADLVGFFRAA